ncbi:MAG: glycosyltransferase [Acidobacteria bacterium]|nr:glycosyltransferase [Acidobacteriota bacterium]
MRALDAATLVVYYAALSGLAAFGVHRLVLTRASRKYRGAVVAPAGALPHVTIQLPIYNEICVVDRLVEAACALDYPRELLEIQILDDSTDRTAGRARELAAAWRGRGHDVVCLHRDGRAGYKAGALAAGLTAARGELIAVFDADFVPPPGFLMTTVPHFADPSVGMVQAAWGHLNRDASLLTRAQALLLDAHFLVEQSGRAASGLWFNFNGTAGVFRRACIEAAGGWQADTLTEDLDLSYRAQLAGWRFVFVDAPRCPAELPAEMDALRSQQHRWALGSIQTARKLMPAILRSGAPARAKLEATIHLTNNAAYLLLLAVSLLIVPSLAIRRSLGWSLGAPDLIVFVAGTGAFAAFCLRALRLDRAPGRGRRPASLLARFAAAFPIVMALGAGLALNNALAVLEAFDAGAPSFRRTPKQGRGTGAAPRRAYRGEPSQLAAVEAFLAIFFGVAAVWAAGEGFYASVPFLVLFAAGNAYVAGLTLGQRVAWRRSPAPGN